MVTEKGVVTKVASDTAWVKTIRSSACESCNSKDSCHTMGGGNEMEVEVMNPAKAKVGENVVIAFETGSLFKLSFLIYVFPIISMIAGAVTGEKLAPAYQMDSSILSVITAFLFFTFAFLIIKLAEKKLSDKIEYRAKIIRVSPVDDEEVFGIKAD